MFVHPVIQQELARSRHADMLDEAHRSSLAREARRNREPRQHRSFSLSLTFFRRPRTAPAIPSAA
ncbi:MAG: hypothetical protein QOE36_3569 [Gaiellaceae bacterium]|nr:hypothetical protein [Gaiellaceae bacterium]